MKAANNKVQLIGTIYGSVETVKLESGRTRTKLVIETNDTIIGAQGMKEKVRNEHAIFCYGKLSEIADKYCKEGTEIAIEGILTSFAGNIIVIAGELLILTKK